MRNEEPTVSRDTFEAYRIRNKGEYATICVRSWSRRTATDIMYCGEILIHSSFGSWANQWTACAVPFPKFLATSDFDYIFEKFMGSDLRVFDVEATYKQIKARYPDNTDLDSCSARHAQTEMEFYMALRDCAEVKEPWEYRQTRYDYGAVGFWKTIWPHFTAELTKEVVPA